MNEYSICTDMFEIVSGTSFYLSPVYKEAVEDINKATPKGFGYIKNFIVSIESLSNKEIVKDQRISESRGNIKSFKGYENITGAIDFLNKFLKDISTVKECTTVLDALEKYQALYTEAYTKNVRLIVQEYENSVYLLVTSLSMILANNMDVVANGSEIRIQKKSATTFGVIPKTLSKLAKELSDRSHKDYIETLINSSDVVEKDNTDLEESTYMESAVGTTLALIGNILSNVGSIAKTIKGTFSALKKSLFGIIPLIRSIIFLRYKKKADTIVSLEEQMVFVRQNIDQLQNRKNIDPKKKEEIIKKQMAVIEKYKKKAEKLRAELCEQEKEAAVEIKKDDKEVQSTDGDDYVLEHTIFGKPFKAPFNKSFDPKGRMHKKPKKIKAKRTPEELSDIRKSTYEETHDLGKRSFLKSIKDIKWSDKEIDEKLNKVAKRIWDATKEKSVRLTLGKKHDSDDPSRITDTKIGGVPYWPQGKEWPTDEEGSMICIAQLNFDKLPKLQGYPTKGLLQFFITYEKGGSSGDEVCYTVYHEKYDPKNATPAKDIPLTTFDVDNYFFFKGVYYPTAEIKEYGITFTAEHTVDGNYTFTTWDDYAVKYTNEEFGMNWKKHTDIPWKEIGRPLLYKYGDLLNAAKLGTRYGGWPNACQYDARDKNHDLLLLSIDSEEEIMIGDVGIMNFFIGKDKLAKKDFDLGSVGFAWDCC